MSVHDLRSAIASERRLYEYLTDKQTTEFCMTLVCPDDLEVSARLEATEKAVDQSKLVINRLQLELQAELFAPVQ